MAKPQKSHRLDPVAALDVISTLQEQAKNTSTDAVKKILLTAGCEIADLALEQSQAGSKAA